MGKPDVALKVWLGNPARFADLFNAILFNGKHVIDASRLEEKSVEHDMIVTSKKDTQKGLQSFRDIVMKWNNEVTLAILACENQEQINYGMPVRTMVYDGMEYSEQIQQICNKINMMEESTDKESGITIPDIYYSRKLNLHKLTPVITLVVYYGDEEWDAPVELYDMLDINRNVVKDDDMLSLFKQYVPNYRINLVVPWKLPDYEVFSTDLHLIFNMLKYKKNRVKLNEFVSKYDSFFRAVPEDTLNVIKILFKTGKRFDKKIEQLKEMNKDEEGSTDFMCVFDEIYEDGVAVGIQRGIEQGIEQGIKNIIEVMYDNNLNSNKIKQTLIEKYNLSEESASSYIDKYIV